MMMKTQKSSTMSNVVAKPNLSFSIESILKEENPLKGSLSSKRVGITDTKALQQEASFPERSLNSDLPWLAYTRYCPPKIPRSRNRRTVNRRKVSGSPRVPFSTEQLLELEKNYEDTHYVTAAKVSQLSNMLKLPGNRIKIWFQNRRAREKKKARTFGSYQDHQTTNETCAETTVPAKPQGENDQNMNCHSHFYCASFERTQSAFSPTFVPQLAYSTWPLNRPAWQGIPNVPRVLNPRYFDRGLYKGLRCFV